MEALQQWWWITYGSQVPSSFHLRGIGASEHTCSHVLRAGSGALIQWQWVQASTRSWRSIQCTSPRLHFKIKIAALLIRLIGLKMSVGTQEAFWDWRQTENRFKKSVFSPFIWIRWVTGKGFKTKCQWCYHYCVGQCNCTLVPLNPDTLNQAHIFQAPIYYYYYYLSTRGCKVSFDWKLIVNNFGNPLLFRNLGKKHT